MNFEDDIALLQIIKSYFMDIGVNMEINVMDKPAFMNFAGSEKHDQMDYYIMTGLTAPPSNALSCRIQGGNDNYTYNNEPDYDALVRQFNAAADDEAKRLCREADRYAIEHHWSVNVCSLIDSALWQPWVKGYSGEIGGSNAYHIARFWIDQDLKKGK